MVLNNNDNIGFNGVTTKCKQKHTYLSKENKSSHEYCPNCKNVWKWLQKTPQEYDDKVNDVEFYEDSIVEAIPKDDAFIFEKPVMGLFRPTIKLGRHVKLLEIHKRSIFWKFSIEKKDNWKKDYLRPPMFLYRNVKKTMSKSCYKKEAFTEGLEECSTINASSNISFRGSLNSLSSYKETSLSQSTEAEGSQTHFSSGLNGKASQSKGTKRKHDMSADDYTDWKSQPKEKRPALGNKLQRYGSDESPLRNAQRQKSAALNMSCNGTSDSAIGQSLPCSPVFPKPQDVYKKTKKVDGQKMDGNISLKDKALVKGKSFGKNKSVRQTKNVHDKQNDSQQNANMENAINCYSYLEQMEIQSRRLAESPRTYSKKKPLHKPRAAWPRSIWDNRPVEKPVHDD